MEAPTSPRLALRLLGGLEVRTADGLEVTPPGRKLRALLVCLALPPRSAWSREQLVAVLWGDRQEEQARGSLREALVKLRRCMGEPNLVQANRETIALDHTLISVDAVEFVRLAKADELGCASDLYRGDLLEGVSLPDAGFGDWLIVERTRLHDLAVNVLSRLVASQDGESALRTAQRLMQLDPTREETHRTLMRLYAAAGDRPQALRQYQVCRDNLERELSVAPSPETEVLYREIRDKSEPQLIGGGEPLRSAPVVPRKQPPLSDRPSIAVLPFQNLSADQEQEHFADGIAEDLITQLSRLRDVLVIARNSTFVFKGRAVRVQEVARDLGVRYVLEGSVRRAGNRIRVTAQLIEAATGGHLWGERYERELTDLFELQDEITKAITVALQVNLTEGDTARIAAEGTRNLQAWEAFLRGKAALLRFTKHDNFQARRFFEQAVHHDPNYGLALVELANTHWVDARFRHTHDPAASLELAKTTLRRAEELVGETGAVLFGKGTIALIERRHDEALELHRRAVELAPSDAYCALVLGMTQVYIGDFLAAIASLKTSLRLSPYGINRATYYLAFAYLWLGDPEQARSHAARYLAREPQEPFAYFLSAIAEAAAGFSDGARDHVTSLLAKHPEMTCDDFAHAQFYRDPERLQRLLTWLKDAGLPEGKGSQRAAR